MATRIVVGKRISKKIRVQVQEFGTVSNREKVK